MLLPCTWSNENKRFRWFGSRSSLICVYTAAQAWLSKISRSTLKWQTVREFWEIRKHRFRFIYSKQFVIWALFRFITVIVWLLRWNSKLQYIFLAFFASSFRVTEEDWLSETAVWPTLFLLNVSTALKGTHNYIFIQYLSMPLCLMLKGCDWSDIQSEAYKNLTGVWGTDRKPVPRVAVWHQAL